MLLDGGVHTRCRPVGQDWANGGQQNEQQLEAPPLTEEPALVSTHARDIVNRRFIRRFPLMFLAPNSALLPQQLEPVKPLVGKGDLVGEGEQRAGAGNRVA